MIGWAFTCTDKCIVIQFSWIDTAFHFGIKTVRRVEREDDFASPFTKCLEEVEIKRKADVDNGIIPFGFFTKGGPGILDGLLKCSIRFHSGQHDGIPVGVNLGESGEWNTCLDPAFWRECLQKRFQVGVSFFAIGQESQVRLEGVGHPVIEALGPGLFVVKVNSFHGAMPSAHGIVGCDK